MMIFDSSFLRIKKPGTIASERCDDHTEKVKRKASVKYKISILTAGIFSTALMSCSLFAIPAEDTLFSAAVRDMADESVTESNASATEQAALSSPLKCRSSFTAINKIQGTGSKSPLEGQKVVVEAIVTADFQQSLNGFYLQTAPGEEDNQKNTSEGLFVFTDNQPHPIAVGDRVRVIGTITESGDVTQLGYVASVKVCNSNMSLPLAKPLQMPFKKPPEAMEGMLVSFDGLTVNSVYQLGRFGTVTLAKGRRFIPTQIATPGDAAKKIDAANDMNSILLDDGSNQQNPAQVPYPPGGLSAQNTLRVGDTMSLSSGVLHHSFGSYRIHPTSEVQVTHANPRTAAPKINNDGDLKVASFNVLNYFTTLKERGADTKREFTRQQDKIVAALSALDAHVVGLMELENNGFDKNSAIAHLVTELNKVSEVAQWQYVRSDRPRLGTGSITTGIIYRADKVTPVASMKILDSSNSTLDNTGAPLFIDRKNRPAIAQEFRLKDGQHRFVISVNHLKSKGSDCNELNDPNTGDGQGNCNKTRTRAAQAVAKWLASEFANKPTLIIGDLNAYAKEDPLTALANAGYKELFAHFNKPQTYGYVYAGESGQLDHALANAMLLESVLDVAEWHINTDEPVILDYNMENKSADQQKRYYAPNPYRSSDHDPLVIALKF